MHLNFVFYIPDDGHLDGRNMQFTLCMN